MAAITNIDMLTSLFMFVRNNLTNAITKLVVTSDTQIGTQASPAELVVTGQTSLSEFSANITSLVSTIQIPSNVSIVSVSLVSLPIFSTATLVLPSTPRVGQLLVIKDASGTASTCNIVIKSLATTIDGRAQTTIASNTGSISLYYGSDKQWHVFSQTLVPVLTTPTGSYTNANITINEYGQILTASNGSGGGGSGETAASYLVLSTTSSLSNERVLTQGTGINFVDTGPNGTLTISATGGSGGGETAASYLVLSTTSSLSAERVLTAGTGINFTDTGANGTLTIASSNPDPNPSFIVLANTSSLPNERVLNVSGSNITLVDNGQNSTVVLDITQVLGSANSGSFTNANITADKFGRITAISNGSSTHYFSLVAGSKTASAYEVIGVLPPTTFSSLSTGILSFSLAATVNIPASSTCQVRLYDVTNHAILYESTVVTGSQTEHCFTSVITPTTGSSVMEFWLSTPTNTGGLATCFSAVLVMVVS